MEAQLNDGGVKALCPSSIFNEYMMESWHYNLSFELADAAPILVYFACQHDFAPACNRLLFKLIQATTREFSMFSN
jgi:hypothetical protein